MNLSTAAHVMLEMKRLLKIQWKTLWKSLEQLMSWSMGLLETSFAQSKNSQLMLSKLCLWLTLLVLSYFANMSINTDSKMVVLSSISQHIFIKLELPCKFMQELQKLELMPLPNIFQFNWALKKSELLESFQALFRELKGLIGWVGGTQLLTSKHMCLYKDLGKEKILQNLQFF